MASPGIHPVSSYCQVLSFIWDGDHFSISMLFFINMVDDTLVGTVRGIMASRMSSSVRVIVMMEKFSTYQTQLKKSDTYFDVQSCYSIL